MRKHFCEIFFLSVSTSKWNLEKSETIVKHLCKSVYTKIKFYSSSMKLLKLLYTPLNVSFLETLLISFSFTLQILREKKRVIFFSFKRKVEIMFFVQIVKETVKLVPVFQKIQRYHQHIFCTYFLPTCVIY